MAPTIKLARIVSGGQTGVDRAALDAAISADLAHGGWCPAGRRAEDGVIDGKYELTETRSSEYAARTERNVLDSAGTLILVRGKLSGGTELTYRLALRHGKPCLVVQLDEAACVDAVCAWLDRHAIDVLNVAGPRESTCPGIYQQASDLLEKILAAGRSP